LIVLVMAVPVRADELRVEMSNLLELQIGRDFANEDEDRRRFFGQFLLDVYPTRDLRLGLRVERFADSPPPELFGNPVAEYEYDRLAQRFVEWSSRHARFRVGNGYAILGHGLLFRAFELPGVVRQTQFPIVSYAESRDLDGVTLDAWYGPLELTLLHGTPVIAPDVAPEQPNQVRRAGSVTGGRAMLEVVEGLRVGGSVLHADGLEAGLATSRAEEFGAVEVDVDLLRFVPGGDDLPFFLRTVVEYAGRSWQPFDGGLRTATGVPHALYSNTQIGWDTGALGIETKDYHQFRLGVNDPPTLVPEFTHRLLNRTTHVLDPLDEKGHQITLGQRLPDWIGRGSIEAVYAQSEGRLEVLGEYRDPREYEQFFVALESDPSRSVRVRVYFSDGHDEFEGLEEIRTVGLLASSRRLPHDLAVELDVGHQVRERRGVGEVVRSDDIAVVASVSRASLGTVGLLWERTDDPLFLDDPSLAEDESRARDFVGGTLSWRVDQNHDVLAFYGERRGGVACTSGTCYFVPDFEGLELRVLSRF
jgi:hypothetical protein